MADVFAWMSCISIHAPVKGATSGVGIIGILLADFNPRPREGSDLRSTDVLFPLVNFNPRPREGSDQTRLPFLLLV